jgi:hypothetical protein
MIRWLNNLQHGQLVALGLVEAPGVFDALASASLVEASESAFKEKSH